MNAYVHTYEARLDGSEYVVTLHVVALGDFKFAETLSVADAETARPLEVCGHMSGEAWGEGLPDAIRRAVATAHANEHPPYGADEERVRRLASLVEYSEVEYGSRQGWVEE